MEWLDEGLLLHIRPHGESGAITTFITQHHGLTKGYIRVNKKYPLQPGSLYHLKYKSKLASNLGLLTTEQHELFGPLIYAALQSPIKLACVNSIRTLLMTSLIDRDIVGDFYTQIKHYIQEICLHEHIGSYVLFEKDLLYHCGFGLDLTRCAVTNAKDNLAYVSPKTGRAVTAEVGRPYAHQLFALPNPLYNPHISTWTSNDILDGLKITNHFLEGMIHDTLNRAMPAERNYLIRYLTKKLTSSST